MKRNTIIIAEAGVNHNGDRKKALDLIDIASGCKADYVKFQTFKAETLSTINSKKADYQVNKNNLNETQYQMLKALELTKEDHEVLIKYAAQKRIKFLSSPFDIESIKLLSKMDLDFFKIPSGEITNLPYLRYMASIKKPVILSTGMATMREIKDAISVLTSSGLKKESIKVLHCSTSYPTEYEDVNLSAMLTIKNELNVEVGYSDHTNGIEIAIAAVALGACVIEKHFTFDRNAFGPDHSASLEPNELKEMISSIRKIEKAIGNGKKNPSDAEINNKKVVRKSIVALNKIKKGEVFSESNLTTKRPEMGKSPMLWDKLVGKKAKRDYKQDDIIID